MSFILNLIAKILKNLNKLNENIKTLKICELSQQVEEKIKTKEKNI